MLLKLFLLFTIVPVVELALLIRIGARIGVLPTVGLVVLTGALGSILFRMQGLTTLRAIQEDLAAGRVPGRRIVGGLFLLVGGCLLVTPGVVTDAVGFLLMLPPVRAGLAEMLVRRFRESMENGGGHVFFFHTGGSPGGPDGPHMHGPPPDRSENDIEADAEVLDDDVDGH